MNGKIIFAVGKNFYKASNYTNTHKKGVTAFIYERWNTNTGKGNYALLFDLRLKKVIAKVKIKLW